MTARTDVDAVVVGAGFAGMYAVHLLRDRLGLRLRGIERGDDVGGTWYWNRYPGARCDVDSMFYCYSFDELLQHEWEWTERFPTQPELLRYARHVADRFDLRRSFSFETEVVAADWDERAGSWVVRLSDGSSLTATFLIAAVGNLSSTQVPAIPGLEDFGGEILHTGAWPHEGVSFSGRRVSVIGTGSSGIQAIPEIARQAESLTVYQRTANFSLPARNRPLTAEERESTLLNYPRLRAEARLAHSGVVVTPPIGSAIEVPEDERERELRRRWDVGGTDFMAAFTDTTRDLRANAVTAEFVRRAIGETVTDPETAETLTPTAGEPIGGKRVCVDTGYFETFNESHVHLVDVRRHPIQRITASGIVTDLGEEPADAIVLATGYDAMTGSLVRLGVRGVGGISLADAWADGPHTFLGLMTAGFPNLFMITGPGSPSVLGNVIVAIEQHVEWIADYLQWLAANGYDRAEPSTEHQERWGQHVNEIGARTMYVRTNSWYVGANIPGKPRVFMPYAGGMGTYRAECDAVAAAGYEGFRHTGADSRKRVARAADGVAR